MWKIYVCIIIVLSYSYLELIDYNFFDVFLHVTRYLLESLRVQLMEYVVSNVVVNFPYLLACCVVMDFEVLFILFTIYFNAVEHLFVIKLHFPTPWWFLVSSFFINLDGLQAFVTSSCERLILWHHVVSSRGKRIDCPRCSALKGILVRFKWLVIKCLRGNNIFQVIIQVERDNGSRLGRTG